MGNFRLLVRAGSAWATLCTISALSASAFGQTPDISGTYWATEYRAKIEIAGGGELPLTAAGKAAYEKNIAGLKDGSVIDVARRYCVADGLPRLLSKKNATSDAIAMPPANHTMPIRHAGRRGLANIDADRSRSSADLPSNADDRSLITEGTVLNSSAFREIREVSIRRERSFSAGYSRWSCAGAPAGSRTSVGRYSPAGVLTHHTPWRRSSSHVDNRYR